MLSRRAGRLVRALRADHGAISIVALILGGVMLAFIGLVWDGGRGLASQQTADDLAVEIGRTAAQCVNVDTYLATGTSQLTSSFQARKCAQPYVDLVNKNAAANGYTVDYTIAISLSRDTFQVSVELDRAPDFLRDSVFGGKYHGHATVKLTQGVTDAGG